MSDLVIVCPFYSGYKDLWLDFIKLFKKYWNNCPYDLVIVSDFNENDEIEGVKVIAAGSDAEYSKKIQTALSQINSKYFLILLEDFFFSKTVCNNEFEKIVEYIKDNDVKYYSMPMSEFSGNYKGKRIEGNNRDLRTISPKAKYTLTCQPAIWDTEFLRKVILKSNYNAWIFEGIYTKSKEAHSEEFLAKCLANVGNPLNIKHGALQQKMIPDTVNYFKKNGYEFCTNRTTLSQKDYFKHKIKIFFISMLPYSVQNIFSRFVKKKTVVSKYENEIFEIMKKENVI